MYQIQKNLQDGVHTMNACKCGRGKRGSTEACVCCLADEFMKIEPPEEKEPPEEIDEESLEASMHSLLCQLWDHPKWKLTPTRVKRYRAMIQEGPKDLDRPDFLHLWRILLRAIWSEPWRRAGRTSHDPVNILKGPEQREGWWEVAEAEAGAGRDGSTYHQDHHEPKGSEQAALERSRRAALSRAQTDEENKEKELQAEVDQEGQEFRAWWKDLDEDKKTRVKAKAQEKITLIWTINDSPPDGCTYSR